MLFGLRTLKQDDGEVDSCDKQSNTLFKKTATFYIVQETMQKYTIFLKLNIIGNNCLHDSLCPRKCFGNIKI